MRQERHRTKCKTKEKLNRKTYYHWATLWYMLYDTVIIRRIVPQVLHEQVSTWYYFCCGNCYCVFFLSSHCFVLFCLVLLVAVYRFGLNDANDVGTDAVRFRWYVMVSFLSKADALFLTSFDVANRNFRCIYISLFVCLFFLYFCALNTQYMHLVRLNNERKTESKVTPFAANFYAIFFFSQQAFAVKFKHKTCGNRMQ